MTSLRRLKSPAPVPPLEDDDLLSEILLRLPPQPSSLPRASLVCKPWLGLVSNTRFLRRFRAHHHRDPPLVGLLREDASKISFVPTMETPNRVSSGRFSFRFDDNGDQFRFLRCRHGLALILNCMRFQFQVWDPVTGDLHRLAVPREFDIEESMLIQNGAVLRAARYVHMGSPFKVVLVGQDVQFTRAFACVCSSDTGSWGDLVSTPLPSRDNSMGIPSVIPGSVQSLISVTVPSVMAGNSLYWKLLGNSHGILEFDLDRQNLSVIPMPVDTYADHSSCLWVMPALGGGLGLLFLSASTAQLWKRKTDSDGVTSWVPARTIEINKLLSLDSEVDLSILGFAEDSNVLFLWTRGSVFMVQLDSLQFRELFKTRIVCVYHPFTTVYTGVLYEVERYGDPRFECAAVNKC